MDDLLNEFLTETNEAMDTLDVELVKLEQNPNDPELLSNIFRLVHTIKGTCGFLGLPRLESVAHAGENILGKIRDGEIEVTPDAVSLVLQCLDQIKMLLVELEANEAEPDGEDSDLISRLNAFADGGGAPSAAAQPAVAQPAEALEESAEGEATAEEDTEDEHGFVPVRAEDTGGDDEDAGVEPSTAPAEEAELAAAAETPEDVAAEAEEVAEPVKAESLPAVAKKEAAKPAAKADPSKETSVANQSIRVNVELLENLMTMISELVLTRNQLMQILRNEADSDFTTPLQRLSHVTTELQEGVMKTRMQPIGNAWSKLPRIVRDLSIELGKKIDLQMIGAETELDRQVLELIKDPLTHMVRNSADHGIEMPDERLDSGKSATGTVTLNAFHEGGHIIIEISDDGKGLNTEKIKEKALKNGMVSEAELEDMTTQQIQQFVFSAGLSTAAAVTSVSGRGVGMDVVRTNIEKIGGTVELKSEEGQGTTFNIKIPLTLAIVSALLIECAGERFAIPQISVVELVLASANSEHKIENIQGTPVLRLRNRLLPLVSLQSSLKIESLSEETQSEEMFIVVSQVGTYTFGIIVDRVFDTEEIVVKPVAPVLRQIPLFSGNTILGDGSVILILDPNGIAAQSGDLSLPAAAAADAHESSDSGSTDRVALLIFRAGDQTPKAVPLALVARLEEIDAAKVERSPGQLLVQYRDQLMPLIPIDNGGTLREEGMQPVIVFSDGDRSMGLIVDEILDIVEDRLNVELVSDHPGFLGSAKVVGQATDILDTGYFLTQAFDDWFGSPNGVEPREARKKRLLLVDDSPFFRNLLTPMLSVAGYDVTAVDNAKSAISFCEKGLEFDVIVSDIEMPEMDGYAFAEAIRNGSDWADVPMIALSSHATPSDLDRGREVGFDDYVAKADRDALVQTLEQALTAVQNRE
ncbi:MAG: response regulator [Alphaproteobacteria bacterium]|nr:response regulator [Alphaproteobacteria bacterium]